VAKAKKSRKTTSRKATSRYDKLTGMAVGDNGTWIHSNAGYNELTSSITGNKFTAFGNTGTPVFWDANRNGPYSGLNKSSGQPILDKSDKRIGHLERVSSAPGDMFSGTWQTQANGVIDVYTSGVLVGHIHIG